MPFFDLAARLTGARPLFTKYALHTISGRDRFSHQKASDALGYQPREMALTIRDTVRWLQDEMPRMG